MAYRTLARMTTTLTGAAPWWAAYADMLHPDMLDMVAAEQAATRILTYEPYLVPGLLQTPEYARAVMATADRPVAGRVERGMALRMRRQEIVGAEGGPGVEVVVDESTLRRVVGGREVMAGQIAHLIDVAGWPGVSLSVVPLAGGPVAEGGHPFTVLHYPAGGPAVFTETEGAARLTAEPIIVARYVTLFGRLAVAGANCAALLASCLHDLED
jgi:hypothetical protein